MISVIRWGGDWATPGSDGWMAVETEFKASYRNGLWRVEPSTLVPSEDEKKAAKRLQTRLRRRQPK